MVINDNKKVAKVAQKFYCKNCDYSCSKKCHFDKHLQTLKHKNSENDNNDNKKVAKSGQTIYVCEICNKSYFYNSGLSRHKKTCNNQIICYNETKDNTKINQLEEDNKELKVMIKELIKENVKHQQQISELIPKIGNNNNTINNNQKFNIQVFLNEKCKDAINITDFIKSIEVSLQQLDFTKQNGLANGLSKTIMDNMNKLSVYERPLHCTDVKRETLYIKDENVWSKDNSKEKIKKAIKKASSKNYNAIQEWKTNNPDFLNNESKTDYFTKTITTIGKSGDGTEEKIIKNLCKETYIKDSID